MTLVDPLDQTTNRPLVLPQPDSALAALLTVEGTQEALDAFFVIVRDCGLSDYSYIAGFAEESPDTQAGFIVSCVSHVSSCPSDWMEELFARYGAEQDYDFIRVVTGRYAPFVSGHNILELMEPMEPHHRNILALKAEAGFGANLIVPLPSAPYAKYCYAAMMLISNLDRPAFEDRLSRSYHRLLSATFLLHHRLGGDAHGFLERESAVKSHLRSVGGGGGAPPPPAGHLSVPAHGLTARQEEVVRMLMQGERPDTIADALSVSRVTVDRHLRAAREALGVKTTTELVVAAVKAGIVSS